MSKNKIAKRGWNSESGYVWSMIGSAVGFANILSFGAKTYQNGGGVFLIPLLIAVMLLGLPMLILEGLAGKTFQSPLVTSFGKIMGQRGKFLAWPTVFGVITIGGFYTVLCTWSLAYIWFSGTGTIPATTESFFHDTFLHVTSSVSELGSFSWSIGLGSLVLLIVIYKINSSPIAKGIEKLSKFFLPILMGLLLLFLVGVFFLPGAMSGMKYLVTPDFSVLRDSKLWLLAFGHVFFSLSIGLAIISGYSAYTEESINITRSMVLVVLGDLSTSIVSAFVIFGCLGHLAFITETPFTEVVSSSSFGLGFVVFPKLFQSFPSPLGAIVGVLFFFSLFLAGITGLMSIIEAAVGNITTELSFSRSKATFLVCTIVGTLSLLFSFGNAAHLIDVLDYMAAGVNVLLSGFIQIVLFLYVNKTLSEKKEWFRNGKKKFYFYSLKYLSPLLILIILFTRIYDDLTTSFDLSKGIRWSWFLLVWIAAYFFSKKSTRSSNKNLQEYLS